MPMTFEQWQATRKWTDKLADVTGLDHDDYPSGWIYRDGAEHIESVEWGCRVVIETSEREFRDLEEAERYLWGEWARDEVLAFIASREFAAGRYTPSMDDDTAFFVWGYRAAAEPYAPRVEIDDCAEVRSVGGDRAVYRFLGGVRAAKVALECGVDLSGGMA